MIEAVAMPGLTGRTIVVIGAADDHGPTVCEWLLTSGATVVATGDAEMLPAPLVDAGTGLPGELHYRRLDPASDEQWAALSEWLSANAGGTSIAGATTKPVDGIVGTAALDLDHAAIALSAYLADHASMVSIGEAAGPGIRSNSVTLPAGRGARPQDVGAAVAFLLSDLAAFVDGAVIPIGERPAPSV